MNTKYRTWEKVVARAIEYPIGENDEDTPRAAVLRQRHAKIGFYMRIAERSVTWITCFFIVAGVIRHW